MNSHQRRKARRAMPVTGCCFQGYSGTTPYPDLMCTDGRMSDMDADGDDPAVWRPPCPMCNSEEYKAWVAEMEDC